MTRFHLPVIFAVILSFSILMFPARMAGAQNPVSGDGSGEGVRIMTYNIHHGAGNDECDFAEAAGGEIPDVDCALDLERIASIIEEEAPAIVGLQEVDRFWARSGGVDQAQELADILGMDVCYGANLDHAADDHADEQHQYGVAVLSTYPIDSCENTFLPIVEGEEQRGLLDARLTVEGVGEVAVLNTHFDHKEPPTRQMQSEAVVEYMQGIHVPVILMGDLNAAPQDGDLAAIQDSMADAWVTGGDSSEGLTYPANPVDPLEKRIDYIFVSSSITVLSASTVDSDDALMAADHVPVVADITFGGVATPSASPEIN